jgi:DMSO reductase anchor subunit
MHPAFSVIVFTVFAGAGLGALAIAAMVDLAVRAEALPLAPAALAPAVALGLLLLAIGLASSTLHLANPRNAWRSLTRWRTSWLSREALCALVLMPLAAVYAAGLYRGSADARLLAFAIVPLAWTLLFCTAMIYASLKPIRQWHTPRVPIGYFVLGHASGALAVLAVLGDESPAAGALILSALALLAVGLVSRLEYWRFVRGDEGSVTLARAIGVAQGVRPPGPASVMAARLLDAGHSRGTFLTREFVARVSPARIASARALAVVAGFALPAVAVALEPELAWLAFGACMIGLMAERWLFFAEARHTVRLYHGEART